MKIKDKGFSLIEMAIVLVIFGLVLASASSILTLFVNRGGAEKTRQMMVSDKNAIVSYAQTNKQLPDNDSDAVTDNDFEDAVSYPADSYNQNFFYYPDPNLWKETWGLTNAAFGNISVVCGLSSTNTSIRLCESKACTSPTSTINNVAFVIVSNGENKIRQTAVSSNIINVYPQGTDLVGINDSDVSTTKMKYDDIVDWISLDELRSKVGCDGESIKFMTQTLPYAKKGTAYSVRLYVDGGIPYVGSGNVAQYGFKIDDVDNDNAELRTDGLKFYFSDSDTNELLTTASTFSQGSFVRIAGNSSNFSQQVYKITIQVQDRAMAAQSKTYTRTFIINAVN